MTFLWPDGRISRCSLRFAPLGWPVLPPDAFFYCWERSQPYPGKLFQLQRMHGDSGNRCLRALFSPQPLALKMELFM